MLKNKQFKLFYEKVFRKEYDTKKTISKIYQEIGNSNDVTPFYHFFLIEYGKYITELNVKGVGTHLLFGQRDLEELSNFIIKYGNLNALQSLVLYFEYSPTQSNFTTAVLNGQTKIINYLLAKYNQIKFVVEVDLLVKDGHKNILSSKQPSKQLKSLDMLYNRGYISVEEAKVCLRWVHSFNFIGLKLPIKSFITIIKFIIFTYEIAGDYVTPPTFFDDDDNSNKQTLNTIDEFPPPTTSISDYSQEFPFKMIPQIEEFERKLEAQGQLDSTLIDPIHQDPYNRAIITKMLELCNYRDFYSNYKDIVNLYFGGYELIYSMNSEKALECAFRFGNSSIIGLVFNISSDPITTLLDNVHKTFYNSEFLFSHYTSNTKTIKKEFIDYIFDFFQDDHQTLFDLVIASSDLEIIEHTINLPIFSNQLINNSIIKFIKSKEALGWFFDEHNNIFNETSWFAFHANFKFELIKHYNELWLSKFSKDSEIIKLEFPNNHLEISKFFWTKDIIDYIFKSEKSFNYNDFQLYKLIFSSKSIPYQLKFEMAVGVYRFTAGNIIKKSIERINYKHLIRKENEKDIGFLNWLVVDHSENFEPNGHFFIDEDIQQSLLLFISRYDGLKIETIINVEPIPTNIDFVSYALTLLFNKPTDPNSSTPSSSLDLVPMATPELEVIRNKFLVNLIKKIGENGDMVNYFYIVKHHVQLLQRKRPGNNNIFTFDELKAMLVSSLHHENLEFAEILFDFNPISKEYGSFNVSDLTKSNFPLPTTNKF